ncbi:hypothetical protein ANCDUO_05015 [Ancylostoma duodenale]|uniref:Uncharacterized protein n=1 Tax=Ancylostoma duodenale TaxID=51022 RepID=A0A0C2H5G6_9BILA|nr:hypothetical protein ANCDUO_05015 [Ancylostoma duodenale]
MNIRSGVEFLDSLEILHSLPETRLCIFDFGGFGGGGFIGGAAVDFEGAPPMPQMPVDDMMMVRAFSDTGAPPPVKIRTEFPESWIVVSINTEKVLPDFDVRRLRRLGQRMRHLRKINFVCENRHLYLSYRQPSALISG